jgi:hypothetical protein
MTTSYARHKASDDLYEKLLPATDQFIETYIGRYGRKSIAMGINGKKPLDIRITAYEDGTIGSLLDDAIHVLTDALSKILKKEDVELWNLRDELVGHLQQAKYLFTLA